MPELDPSTSKKLVKGRTLNAENYYSQSMSQAYMGSTQYKNFAGTPGSPGCEARALAELSGEWHEEPSQAMLIGSYIDSHFEGTLDVFKALHPDIFTKQGELMASFRYANEIINRIERDAYFMKFMSGEKQKIFTANMFGCDWKIKLDSYLPGVAIVDLKIMGELRKTFWNNGVAMSFIENWGYDIQAAIYQKVVEINTGDRLPFFIAGASKEKPEPDIEIIAIDDETLDKKLFEVEQAMHRINALKSGEELKDPVERCGQCDYCRNTKVLEKPIHYSDLTFFRGR